MASPSPNQQPEETPYQDVNGDYDEDEALKAAIASSLKQEAEKPRTSEQKPTPKGTKTLDQVVKVVGPDSWLLDRKKMEEARLQRLRKRTAEDASLDGPQGKRLKIPATPGSTDPTTLRQDASASILMGVTTSNRNQVTRQVPELRFPRGVVKRTWVHGFPRTNDDIKIEEVLEKDKLELAVVSSFQWDEPWLLSKVDTARTRMVFIAYAKNGAEQETLRASVPSSRIKLCFPPMYGIGCMHSKLQLLKYQNHLRIVVPSGNLVPYDWGETGVLENMVFLIDLPRIVQASGDGDAIRGNDAAGVSFGTELRRFLRAQGLDESLVKSLDNFDFTETERFRFIHTIAGGHTDQLSGETGYHGLSRAVHSLGLSTDEPITVDYVAQQDQNDGGNQPSRRNTKTALNATDSQKALGVKMRIYFPTEDTVARSRGGKAAGGTICFQEKWWGSATFPREMLRDSISTRPGVLMHDKIIFVQPNSTGGQDDPGAGWAYVGSANLSESAWGRLTKERGSGRAKLTCRNWECGVLVPTRTTGDRSSGGLSGAGEAGKMLEAFRGAVPVPMVAPSRAYGTSSNDTAADRPWLFMKRY
ncbi:tyrosyl-DNA phosphodiesterase domain-containing protein [Verticillium alfalfae VaMs.102]|uniref:Tyrosyl-DNA phosphodiesterase domain-containing protein n=1 Tax=Verticillium alfalfae (strain VaMs.102 / ATCC MYA-4576 / FGSC 10136) TaxID=526221 RepID=C9SUR2_VERA1|nr:tyrosyl-DNA phosphodiesterase domain-containing protein [Verticillium alfalfae VaMs.102]EEY22527.1 tyrosyl-DNA phosphodiesterase domain-containing protein [Verticillium alfalfae VaMs.102]